MIRVPHSSGRYPAPTWRVTLKVYREDAPGAQVLTFNRTYEIEAKTADTAMGRVLRFWKRRARGRAQRIGRGTAVMLQAVKMEGKR